MKTTLPLRPIFLLAALCSYTLLLSQNPQADEIQTPELSPFSVGQGSLQGAIANSVQEVTGKVNISLPIVTLKSRTLSYPVTLSYNGNAVFKQAQYLNQFSTQSTLGVGWALQQPPKIVADYKGTAARDDDTFYLADGSSNTRLICTKKTAEYWEFEMENYKPHKIRYEIGNTTTGASDLWILTDDKGITYTYGLTDNARENVLAWGNWIGDSKNFNGATPHTTVWNLAKIEDQWSNSLSFTYEEVNHQINNSDLRTHTSASYLKEITSSTGGKTEFTYGEKGTDEYYELHKEQPEPDAYQERFETKYLEAITVYDNANREVYTYTMEYEIHKKANNNDQNRYLQSIIQHDSEGSSLPPLQVAYHTTGAYEGGIAQITYPSGGSVTYTYTEHTVFDATDPPIEVEGTLTSGYSTMGRFVGNDYALQVMRQGEGHNGRRDYRMKVVYDSWAGQGWKRSEFVFPELVVSNLDVFESFYVQVETLKFVAGKDFFAFLWFDKNTDKGSVYLFHKAGDGLSWIRTDYRNINLQSNNNYDNDAPAKDPVLMAGENFVAVGENQSHNGRLYTYTWNGSDWNAYTMYQGAGTYYYGAANNFIIALEEDGGPDLITGTDHPDNYYIHYVDAEKRWYTKSWSSTIDYTFAYVDGTNDPSYLYPSNSMAGFMADNDPEYILRWDTDYNLIAVDNVLGSHTDSFPLLPVMNNMFVLFRINSEGNPYGPIKGMGFDGSGWLVEHFPNDRGAYALSDNTVLTGKGGPVANDQQPYLCPYNPNVHQWSQTPIGPSTLDYGIKGFGQDFFVVNDYGYKIENTGAITSLGKIPYDSSVYYHLVQNNLSGVYKEEKAYYKQNPYISIPGIGEGHYFYLNKKNGLLVVLPISSYERHYGNYDMLQLGARTNNYMSSNIFYLEGEKFKRLVEAAPNRQVKDIVVSGLAINNGAGEVRHIAYTYTDAHTLPDDQSTFYGEVTLQNQGDGTGNIGKTKKYFKTGKEDVRLAGLPVKVLVEDKNGNPVSETETLWKEFTKTFTNTAFRTLGGSFYIKPEKTTEKLFFNGQQVITETQATYNTLGLLTQASRKNSDGETETTSTTYAYENNTAVKNKNMLAFPEQTKTEIAGEEVAVEYSLWKSSGYLYPYQNKSGTTANSLRIDNEITQVDNYGNVLESYNGQGLYKTVLYSYDFRYPVVTITNATYGEVMDALTVSYAQLQGLNNTELETELTQLYTQLPQAMVTVDLYDTQGRVVRSLDERGEAVNFTYDSFGRLEYTTDARDKVLEKKAYNYGAYERIE